MKSWTLKLLLPAVAVLPQDGPHYSTLRRLAPSTICVAFSANAAALARVKTKVRASVIRQLDSNSGMAAQLAFFHVNYGNWRKVFTGIDEINKVTAEDVQRVASKYFVDRDRTVVYTVSRKGKAPEAEK